MSKTIMEKDRQTARKEGLIYDVVKFKFPGIANLEVDIDPDKGKCTLKFDTGRYTHDQVYSFVKEFIDLCKKK